MVEKEVKVIGTDEIEAIQPLKPGCYEKWILDKKTPTENLALVMVIFDPGKRSGMHKHNVEEAFFILRGHGRAMLAGKEYEIKPNVSLYCPAETPHNIINTSTSKELALLAFLPKVDFETTLLY